MCGITGIFYYKNSQKIDPAVLQGMTDILSHRGPDDDGYYIEDNIGLGQRRLSIIDIAGGKQPMHNEDKTLWVIFNGEIFNYIEIREELEGKGHRFYTHSDTEVIVHAYEQWGKDFLNHFNGQFAIALWDDKRKELILARDRVGIRPLFYAVLDDRTLLFGSEMKAILKYPGVTREIDPAGIRQIFTYWVNIPPQTVFKGIEELPPGRFLVCGKNGIEIKRYWKLNFPREKEYDQKPLNYYTEKLSELLYDATTIRLRADVPVASYLSGGIDSSVISALVKKHHNNDLITFSVAFGDKDYDERRYQQQMVKFLKTDHRMVEANYDTIGKSYSQVVWFAEKPMIRTAPGPLFLLSQLVRDNNIKVVLTGEGADEVFGGYGIFKEDKIRRFWVKFPNSQCRPLLLAKIYPYILKDGTQVNAFWQQFFKKNLLEVDNPYYSHLIRWDNTAMIRNYFRPDFWGNNVGKVDYRELSDYLNPEMSKWHPLARAQYLEMDTFMSGYLLSSQGDRMMMGNSVEGRFPYLDYRVMEFASQIPPHYKIRGLNEKYILKKTYQDLIPLDIIERHKQPYRAPIVPCFTGENADPLIAELLQKETIDTYGYFDSNKVAKLFEKIKRFPILSARDDMAVVAIVSTQLLHHHFVENFQ
jgi:asparagine synthase (glutamine-hydrolysing)